MVDRDTILNVFCSLMKHPQFFSETDRYNLTPDDFDTLFDKTVFAAIRTLYDNGAENITVADIDSYFNTHQAAKELFKRENGVEFLLDGMDYCLTENFPFYYRRLKKFNCLRDIKKLGFDTSQFYCENLTNPKAKQINDAFEDMEVSDIFDKLRRSVMMLETEYKSGDASETRGVNEKIEDLLKQLKVSPEVGADLQGKYFNTVCRGAQRTKFYIRSADSGTGKTRAAVGDACYLSYPIRFNQTSQRWEYIGSAEKSLFIATEQDLDEIQTLVLSYLTGFDEEKILYGQYTEYEQDILDQAIRVMDTYEDNFKVVRLSNPNIEQIKAVIRQNWLLYDVKNVFYDYIFSSPSLLNEFRDLRIREDVALGMLSTALKDLAVEMKLFIMSSTQTNAKSNDDNNKIKNESVIRGSRAIIDKCDIGCVISRVTPDDLEVMEGLVREFGEPNQVTDVYKVRRGRYTNVKIWSHMDLGTCRKEDLFVTNAQYVPIDITIKPIEFSEDDDIVKAHNLLLELNGDEFKVDKNGVIVETEIAEEKIEEKVEETTTMFGGLL